MWLLLVWMIPAIDEFLHCREKVLTDAVAFVI